MWDVLGVLLAMAVSGLLYTSVFFYDILECLHHYSNINGICLMK